MAGWTVAERERLEAVIDRIIPADDDPGAIASGAEKFVALLLEREASGEANSIRLGLDELAESAKRAGGRSFPDLAASEKDAALREIAEQPWFRRLAEWTAEGFYADPGNGGNAGAASWRMVGYEPRMPATVARRPPLMASEKPNLSRTFDAIVVGAGAAGGIVACVLAEAGKTVLLVERGELYGDGDAALRDHLRNHRLAAHGHNTGPDIDGNPRVHVGSDGVERIVRPHMPEYHNNAAAVGGGTLVYGAQAWRFHPDDFRMASAYGVPENSSLADWPLGYDDLAPFYEKAEWEIGVAGAGHTGLAPRRRGYPLPPVPGYAARRTLEIGAKALGIATCPPPLAINTAARSGRAACIQCGSCVGFPCPSDSKNGTQNTVIPRALATGRCVLLAESVVERIATDAAGRVTGVGLLRDEGGRIERTEVRARTVILSAGAIESARLLLLSANSLEPHGLGNANGLVGRNLQGHTGPVVYGLFDNEVQDPRGPGVTIATCDYVHGNPGAIGGAMLADDFIMLPVIFWKQALPPDVPRWGAEAKDFMRRNYRRVLRIWGAVQDIPNPDCRVTLAPHVRDRWGLPVARLSGVVHPETIRTARLMFDRARGWLEASGARRTWGTPPGPRLSGGQHQAGTCRMGTDPKTSVTDPFGRVRGHENLFVCDGALHPTNGGFNPVLTIMALAFRNAEAIAKRL